MQEFNITSNSQVSPNKVDVKSPQEVKERQELLSHLKEKIAGDSGTPNAPLSNPNKGFRLPSVLFIVFMFTTIILTVTTIFFAAKYFTKEEETPPDENGGDSNGEAGNGEDNGDGNGEDGGEDEPALKNGRIAYVDAANSLNLVDPFGIKVDSIPLQLEANTSITKIYFFSKNELAFIACTQDKTACSINIVDIVTKEQSKRLDVAGQILSIDWMDKDNFVYALNSASEIEILYNKGNLTQSIARTGLKLVTRDPFIEDTSRIELSPEQDRILFIQTNSGEGFNFNTYVYDFERQLLDQIENSTMSTWKDNDSIVYRYYSNKNTGPLYIRDVADKKSSELIDSPSASYNPQVKGRSLIYWEFRGDGTPYIYDFLKESYLKLYSEGVFPFWIGPHNVLVAKARVCEINECASRSSMERMTDLFFESILLVDTSSLKMEETAIDPQIFSNTYDIYWE